MIIVWQQVCDQNEKSYDGQCAVFLLILARTVVRHLQNIPGPAFSYGN